MVTKLVTPPKVSPSDWLTNPSSVNRPWQIWYRFNGSLVKLQGMNRVKDYRSRVLLTKQILQNEEERLKIFGYNPIVKTFIIEPPRVEADLSLEKRQSFISALNHAYTNLKISRHSMECIKSCLKYISLSAKDIGIDRLMINEISRKHIKLLMSNCEKKRNLSARNWNAYRAYLMMLFEQLNELEMVGHNPVRELKKKREIIKFRTTLDLLEREKIKTHLRINYPEFYRFIQIFFHSGSRRTELLSLRVKDVFIEKGEFIILIKKGRQQRYVKRVIKGIARPFWEEQLRMGNPDDYVFSIGLYPGPQRIREEQVTRRWKEHVKDKLGIKADMYSLKHLNTDETASLLDIEAAAAHNGHTSSQITLRHYAFGEAERSRQKLKFLKNEF